MDIGFWGLAGILVFIIIVLLIKIHLLHKAADEIKGAFTDRMEEDTNVLIDISSRDSHMRNLAESVNAQLRLLRKERRRFQQGDAELKDAVTSISHDLRTPLTAIFGYLELLEKEEKSETAKRYLNITSGRAETLKQLTEELFRYSVVRALPEEEFDCEPLDLNRALEDSISAYYGVLKGCRITPVIDMPEEKVIRRLDKGALSRIFANIISNAVKYSDGDLEITLRKDGAVVFANHASNLDEVQVGRLFDRFYTVENAKKSTGLGLSIAKVLTEQMNGVITAEYEKGMIKVKVTFPE